MQNIKDFYIRGKPIDTPLGKLYFIKMEQYEEIYKYQKLLFFNKEDLYDSLKEILDLDKEDILKFIKSEYIEKIKNYQIVELIKGIRELGYYDIFKSIYDYFCGENIFDNLVLSDKDLLVYKIQIMGKLKSLLNDREVIKNTDNNKEKDENIFVNIIKNIKQIGLYRAYSELFDLCFKDNKESFDKIHTDKELQQYIQLIIDMNCISKMDENDEDENIDPEIKKFNIYDKLIKESKQGNVTFKSMYASLWLALQKQPEFLTLYQYKVLFEQLGQFKNFDATTNGYSEKIVMWCDDVSKSEEKENQADDIDDEIIDKAINSMQKVVGDIT